MAKGKQKKKRNKQYRPKYVTGGRVDMSKGGRVSLAHGGKPVQPIRQDYPWTAAGTIQFNKAMQSYTQQLNAWEAEHATMATQEELQDQFESERRERIIETGTTAEDVAAGIMPETFPTIPTPKEIPDDADTKIDQAAEAFKMQQTKAAEAAKVDMGAVTPEAVIPCCSKAPIGAT